MTNTYNLIYNTNECGSGTITNLSYVKNNNGINIPYGNIQIPCTIPIQDRESYVRTFFINDLKLSILTDQDTIYTNGILFYKPCDLISATLSII